MDSFYFAIVAALIAAAPVLESINQDPTTARKLIILPEPTTCGGSTCKQNTLISESTLDQQAKPTQQIWM